LKNENEKLRNESEINNYEGMEQIQRILRSDSLLRQSNLNNEDSEREKDTTDTDNSE
jgi:hypothetical protein